VSSRLVLETNLGVYDHVKALRDGRVKSDRVELKFREFKKLVDGFRYMVREGDLDVSELAVASHILAFRFDKPIVGIAIPLWSRLPHTNLVCPVASDLRGPKDMEGKKVGVRAYGQTSGVWVRGILETEYDVDLNRIHWVTMEDAHLAEYVDPPTATRSTSPKDLRQQMMDGELVAIMGERVVDPAGVRTVIPDAEAAARKWVETSGIVPVNHVLTVQKQLVAEHPWLPQELMRMFEEARKISEAEGGIEQPPPYGLENNRRSLQMAIDFAARQQLVPRAYGVDELFLPV
jgi:4,5-dihydroxyphthalate decarboxylase